MSDNCALPKMPGRPNLPYQAFSFFDVVLSAPITTGITVTLVGQWILRELGLDTFPPSPQLK